MRPYLDAAHQNEKNALSLYRWHASLTAAVASVLGLTEVILRNAMDRELQRLNDAQTHGNQSWLLSDPAAPLRSLSAGKRKEANERALKASNSRLPTHGRYQQVPSHDDVLAQVTFGLWKELLPNHQAGAGNTTENTNRDRLWKEALEGAFPEAADPKGEATFWLVFRLHQLRNRVSHMEPLLSIDVKDRTDDAFTLLRSIDRDVAAWVSGGSKVSEILKLRPEV